MFLLEIVHLLPELSELAAHAVSHNKGFNLSHAVQVVITNETDLHISVARYDQKDSGTKFTYNAIDYNVPPLSIEPRSSTFFIFTAGNFMGTIDASLGYKDTASNKLLFNVAFKNPYVGGNDWSGTGATADGYELVLASGDGKGSDCHVTFVFSKSSPYPQTRVAD